MPIIYKGSQAVETDPNYDPSQLVTGPDGRRFVRNAQGVITALYEPVAPIKIATPDLGGSVNFLPPVNSGAPLSFAPDPLLAGALSQGQEAINLAKAPVDPTKFIAPGAQELLTKGVNDQLNVARASAQSDFAARGLTGGSTEVQTLTRDLPAAANTALAEGTVKLLQAAYPLAIAEKQGIIDATFKSASLTTQVRSLVGVEKFKSLSLDQQRELANQDVQLKLKLAEVEMKFQIALKQAEFAFTSSENEKDREAARTEFNYLVSERRKARESAFISTILATAGTIVGAVYGGPAGAAVGGAVGNAVGGAISTAGESSGSSRTTAAAPKFSDQFLTG